MSTIFPCQKSVRNMLPVAFRKRNLQTRESLGNIAKIPLQYRDFLLLKSDFPHTKSNFPQSAFCFLQRHSDFPQRLSAFFSGFPIFLNGFRHQHNQSKYSRYDYFDSYIIFHLSPSFVITQHTPVVHLCSQQCAISKI